MGMGLSRRKASGRRGVAAALGVLALLLQTFLPWVHAAAMASADPGTIILCTADGPKAYILDIEGTARPAGADQAVELPPACPGCLGAPVLAAILPLQPAFGPADRPADPPVLLERIAAAPEARAGPSQPRAPPASL